MTSHFGIELEIKSMVSCYPPRLIRLYPNFRPKFAKCYIPEILNEFENTLGAQADLIEFGRLSRRDGLAELALLAINKFVDEVKSGTFPSETYSYVESR
jgi:Ketopantoate hydroxymethyltransferase